MFLKLYFSFFSFFSALLGQPRKLIYSIEAGNEASDLFFIDPDSGMMSNVASLDYEAKPHHQLRVRATDTLNGGYSEAIVLFEVEDVRVISLLCPLL